MKKKPPKGNPVITVRLEPDVILALEAKYPTRRGAPSGIAEHVRQLLYAELGLLGTKTEGDGA